MPINFSRYETYDTTKGYGSAKQWRGTFNERMTGKEAKQVLEKEPQTPMQLLGLSPGYTMQQLKTAYREKMMQWHPDRNPGRQEEATEMSKKINAAYTILSGKK